MIDRPQMRVTDALKEVRPWLVGFLFMALVWPSFSTGSAQAPEGRPNSVMIDAPLRAYAQRLGFHVGAAVNMSPFRNETPYTDTLKREFNVIVAENAFKFEATHPTQNTYNFTDTDALVNFAESNGMKIRGHTLVWHSQLPGWVTSGSFTRDQAIQLMHDHISALVGRYAGRIWAWDVVNEAIDDGPGDSRKLRTTSFWYQKIGPDYVDLAFRFAHEADPDALLYYNDYNTEGSGTKSDAAYNLVSTLKSSGVPIDGVGWQCHFVNPFQLGQAHHTNAQRLGALGLLVSITELDVRIQLPTTTTKLDQQAQAYRDLIDFALAEPNVNALVMWGFTDKYSWVPGFFPGFGEALIFDASYQAKPSYQALLDGLKAVPLQPVLIQFDAASYSVGENLGSKQITVTRTGNPDPVTVEFATSDGTGHQRTDYEIAAGTISFGAGEMSKTFTILINDNAYQDGSRTLNLTLSSPTKASLGLQSTAVLTITDNDAVPPAANPLDEAQSFVRQHYYDFLGREPDSGGLSYWTGQITQCGSDPTCLNNKRIDVSNAFFYEQEFQATGAYVYRVYKAAFGARPTYNKFMLDRPRVIGGAELDQSKTDFANSFVQRPAFLALYPNSLTAAQYVDTLNTNTGSSLTQAERDSLVNGLGSTETRASVLRKIADNLVFIDREYNASFVLTQYFGYLRRNADQGGYDFWLGQVNSHPVREVGIQHAMVCSFITAPEYQLRFSSVVTHTNGECQ